MLVVGDAGCLPRRARLRNLSDGGAELVLEDGEIAQRRMELIVPRSGAVRQAQVIWSAGDRLGLAFVSGLETPSGAPILAPLERSGDCAAYVAARLRDIGSRAGGRG